MEKEKAEGNRIHIKLRLPQERQASGSGEMNKALTPEVEIVVARILSHLITWKIVVLPCIPLF